MATTGVPKPWPSMGDFHLMLFSALHWMGADDSIAPVPLGPRHCAQAFWAITEFSVAKQSMLKRQIEAIDLTNILFLTFN
ncbi:MAG: hypothetical protein AAF483_06530 [Planctomycetota bacterium]